MGMIVFLLALVIVFSVIAFIIGLFKVIFQKEDKAFGIKLLIYSTIILIIGMGTCVGVMNFGGLQL